MFLQALGVLFWVFIFIVGFRFVYGHFLKDIVEKEMNDDGKK